MNTSSDKHKYRPSFEQIYNQINQREHTFSNRLDYESRLVKMNVLMKEYDPGQRLINNLKRSELGDLKMIYKWIFYPHLLKSFYERIFFLPNKYFLYQNRNGKTKLAIKNIKTYTSIYKIFNIHLSAVWFNHLFKNRRIYRNIAFIEY